MLLPACTFNNVEQIYNTRKVRNESAPDTWQEHYPREYVGTPDIIISYFEHARYNMNDIIKCITLDYKTIDLTKENDIKDIVAFEPNVKSLLDPYTNIPEWYYSYMCLIQICNIINLKIAPMLGIHSKPCTIKTSLKMIPKTNIKFVQDAELSLMDLLITIEEMHKYIYRFADKVLKNAIGK